MTTPRYLSMSRTSAHAALGAVWLDTMYAHLVTPAYVFDPVTPAMPVGSEEIAVKAMTNLSIADGKAKADNVYFDNATAMEEVGGIVFARGSIARLFLASEPTMAFVTPAAPFWLIWQDGGVFRL